jgi:hypothetical protein
MTLSVDQVEALFRKHWQIPSDLSPSELHEHAFRISVMLGQKYSRDNLKYQLSLIQTRNLGQKFDETTCDSIASDLLVTSCS